MGFNCGLNEAEAINFGTDKWLEVFDRFRTCTCPNRHNKDTPKQALKDLSIHVKNIRATERVNLHADK